MTEMVSLPSRIRSTEVFAASTGEAMEMSRPSVSWSPRYFWTRPMRLRSWARDSSSQKIAGVPERRARVTASLTQSWIGASLVWQAR